MSDTNSATGELTDSDRARIQLQADFINGLAMNVQAIGTLGFLAALMFTNDIGQDKMFMGTAFSLLCFFGGFCLHYWASVGLKELDR